jgi:Rrf2 family protein
MVMGITKKTEYALRALYEIALSGNQKPVNRKTISRKQKISEHFLERILIDLLKADITKSVRGPGGGFILNKKPAEISVWDVFTAVENRQHLYEKCALYNEEECELYKKCPIRYIWPKINQTLKKSMDSISLYEISQKNPPEVIE